MAPPAPVSVTVALCAVPVVFLIRMNVSNPLPENNGPNHGQNSVVSTTRTRIPPGDPPAPPVTRATLSSDAGAT